MIYLILKFTSHHFSLPQNLNASGLRKVLEVAAHTREGKYAYDPVAVSH